MTIKDFFVEDIKKISNLHKNKKEIAKKFNEEKCRNKTWFLSSEGKKAYQELHTPGEKAEFFYQYFRCLKEDEIKNLTSSALFNAQEILSILAQIMPSIENLDAEFSSYPSILDENKNPLINYILTREDLLTIKDPKNPKSKYRLLCLEIFNLFSKKADSIQEIYKSIDSNNLKLKELQYDIIFLIYLPSCKNKDILSIEFIDFVEQKGNKVKSWEDD